MYAAIKDLKTALSQYPVWTYLGWLDVRQRYRRSILGPWWISIGMLIFIGAISQIFSQLFKQDLHHYVPFFTAGFIFWTFISTQILESTDLFNQNKDLIQQIPLPQTLYILRYLTKNAIILSHNLLIYALVLGIYRYPLNGFLLQLPFSLLLLLINLYWMSLLVALLSTRFQDIKPMVNSAIQVLFFVTPISWAPQLIGSKAWIVESNPFTYLIYLVRNPLLGLPIESMTWIVSGILAGIGLLGTLLLFDKAKAKIPFWVE